MPAKTKIRKVKNLNYLKISIFLVLFLFSLLETKSIEIPKIALNIQDSFVKNDIINFNYTISLVGNNKEPLQIAYFTSVKCPNAPQGLIELKNAILTNNNSVTGTHLDFKVSSSITQQACNASVTIMQPFSFSQYKSFDIITDPLIFLYISTDKKVYFMTEEIIIKSTINVFPDDVRSSIIFPDGTKKDITLPYKFKPDQAGTYTVFVSASKSSYESSEAHYSFAVIAKQAQFKSASQCNSNNICDQGETTQNCPQDCASKSIVTKSTTTISTTTNTKDATEKPSPLLITPKENKPSEIKSINPQSNGIIYALFIGIAVFILLFLIVETKRKSLSFDRLHELAKENKVHTVHIELDKLVNYIFAARKYGFPDTEIQKKLTDLGWIGKDIDNAFIEADSQKEEAEEIDANKQMP